MSAISGTSAISAVALVNELSTALSPSASNPSPSQVALDSAGWAASLDLSSTAMLIESLQTADAAGGASSALIQILSPLLAGAPTPNTNAPDALATALNQSIGQSGLFYESHLADWSAGNLSLNALLTEPQAARTDEASPQVSANAMHSSADAPMNTGKDPSPGGGATASIDTRLATLVQAQLSVLDQQGFTWQGFIWPGQAALIQFFRDQQEQGNDSSPNKSDAKPAWRSRITLELPRMGTVNAELLLHQSQLTIRMDTRASEVKTLQAGLLALSKQLEAAGIPPGSLSVTARETP